MMMPMPSESPQKRQMEFNYKLPPPPMSFNSVAFGNNDGMNYQRGGGQLPGNNVQ
jgi:hypothetical protein